MPYHLTIEEKPSYLYAKVTGTHTPENARRFLVEAHEACVKRNYSTLLLEMSLTGPSLGATSIFNVISERSPDALKFRCIAYVDTSDRDPKEMKFAETVARNRGVNVRLFRNLADAELWIRGSAIESRDKAGGNKG